MTSTSLRRAGILGVGSFLPPQTVTNDDLAKRMETSDEWIRSRTGIGARRIASPETATSDLAAEAGRKALEDAQLSASDLDLIIVATCTPDHPGSFPSTAALVQNALEATNAGAFDLGAVCSGFTYALHVAAQMVQTGANHHVLVIGAETLSRIVNWDDRSTAVLFGDGAGAAVVGEVAEGGYLGGFLGANGGGAPLLAVPAGGSRQPLTPKNIEARTNTIYQNGAEVYKFAVSIMGETAARAIASVGLTLPEIDWLVPHQANIRIIEKAASRIGLTMEKVVVNLDRYGNTSSATIPIALNEAVKDGRIKTGNLLVFVGFGGGLTWGANVVRWSK